MSVPSLQRRPQELHTPGWHHLRRGATDRPPPGRRQPKSISHHIPSTGHPHQGPSKNNYNALAPKITLRHKPIKFLANVSAQTPAASRLGRPSSSSPGRPFHCNHTCKTYPHARHHQHRSTNVRVPSPKPSSLFPNSIHSRSSLTDIIPWKRLRVCLGPQHQKPWQESAIPRPTNAHSLCVQPQEHRPGSPQSGFRSPLTSHTIEHTQIFFSTDCFASCFRSTRPLHGPPLRSPTPHCPKHFERRRKERSIRHFPGRFFPGVTLIPYLTPVLLSAPPGRLLSSPRWPRGHPSPPGSWTACPPLPRHPAAPTRGQPNRP